ncbi:MAG: hypothetical protein AB4372_12675 [Xenococcus sp. (in: cyanobacteria)]
MTRQETLKTINKLILQKSEEKLEAILGWLEQEDDDFEKQLRADVKAGKLDQLIASVIVEDDSGETLDLETSCNQDILEAI